MEKVKSEIETLTVSNKDQESKNAELMKEISEIKSLVKEMSEKLKALEGEKKELENIVEKINHQNLAFALNDTDTGLKKKINNEKSIEIIKEISILVENKDPQDVLKEAEKQFGVFTQIPDCRIIKEFKDVQDIYLDLLAKLEKHESVKSAQKSLRDHLKQMRKSKFNEALLLLNSRLKKLYNALTMGGIAELELLDNLSPFAQGLQLTVMPPNKTWRNVGNLSGGEKTLRYFFDY
ncbi:MAG: Structural maintenance of chromosomes protein 4 [Paramarteilia canceri]